jgi:hypothetical protein
MTTCYLKTSHPEFYTDRTLESDYEMKIFTESNIQVSGQTVIYLKIACKMMSGNNPFPFMIIPDESLYNTPVRFSGSPVFINEKDYYSITLYLTNTSPYIYTIAYGKPIAKITLLNTKFNLIVEPL